MTTIREMVEAEVPAWRTATDLTLKDFKDVLPKLVIYGPKEGQIKVLDVPFSNDMEKQNAMMIHRLSVQFANVVRMSVFISEASILSGKLDKNTNVTEKIKQLRQQAEDADDLSTHPDARRVIMFSCLTKDEQLIVVMPVVDGQTGEPEYIDPAQAVASGGGMVRDLIDRDPSKLN